MTGIAFIGFVVTLIAPAMLPPVLRQTLDENKAIFYGGLFVLYQLGSAMLQTGAFEVEVDGQVVFSKLQTGASPDLQRIFSSIGEIIRQKSVGAA